MATTPDRHQDLVGVREVDGPDHIGRPGTTDNEAGPSVDQPIPDGAHRLIEVLPRAEYWTSQARRKGLEGRRPQVDSCTTSV
jgi:hypothetical protein